MQVTWLSMNFNQSWIVFGLTFNFFDKHSLFKTSYYYLQSLRVSLSSAVTISSFHRAFSVTYFQYVLVVDLEIKQHKYKHFPPFLSYDSVTCIFSCIPSSLLTQVFFPFSCDSIPCVFHVYHHCYLLEMDLLGTWMWICSHGPWTQLVLGWAFLGRAHSTSVSWPILSDGGTTIFVAIQLFYQRSRRQSWNW